MLLRVHHHTHFLPFFCLYPLSLSFFSFFLFPIFWNSIFHITDSLRKALKRFHTVRNVFDLYNIKPNPLKYLLTERAKQIVASFFVEMEFLPIESHFLHFTREKGGYFENARIAVVHTYTFSYHQILILILIFLDDKFRRIFSMNSHYTFSFLISFFVIPILHAALVSIISIYFLSFSKTYWFFFIKKSFSFPPKRKKMRKSALFTVEIFYIARYFYA